ncbi:MAG TPA: pilus assembly protein [Dermatophilaceae bacterium]|nr:pilus assembly protein [Dermatophilaceae bacterium]HMT90636.1 pilus assembly protein [Dermatophilaceae bacterium]
MRSRSGSGGSRSRRRELGAAAVEFAIVFPLLLLIVAGIVDFGRAFFTEIQLANAAREGARAAVVSTLTLGQVQARAAASAPTVTGMTTTATLCTAGVTNATVTTSVAFEWFLLQPAVAIFGSTDLLPTTLQETAVMKCGG